MRSRHDPLDRDHVNIQRDTKPAPYLPVEEEAYAKTIECRLRWRDAIRSRVIWKSLKQSRQAGLGRA